MKATAIFTLLLALAGVGGAVAYQTVAQDRQYRRLVTEGDAALREDQTFGAIESYSGAIALRPDSMLAYLRRGETYERRGDLDAAARDFQTAASLAPTATRPLEELADIRFRQERFRRAADLYAAVLRVDDHSAAVSYKHALALYRDGDRLIVDPSAVVRRGDRVVVKTVSGEVMAKILAKRSAELMELQSLNPAHAARTILARDVLWIARIVWASQ